jgi:glycosyltransferase involved in cell wall biosynthesis
MKIELSAVVPVFNEGPDVARFIQLLAQCLSRHTASFEIVVVDDGSTDQSIEAVLAVAAQCRVRVLRLSRNFGKESALSAGLHVARGDAAVLIDGDFQHPPEVIEDFVRLWRGGAHMVIGVRSGRATDSPVRRLLSSAFYRVFNWLANVRLEQGAGDFRLLDRKVITALNALPERRRFMKGLYSWVGFRTERVTYTVGPRAFGASKWSLRSLSRFALQGLISFSERPLSLLAYLGFAFAIPALGYGGVILVEALFSGNPVPGWPTIVTAVMFFGGMNLVALSLIGRYVGELFLEVKGRPAFVVMSDEDFLHSSEPAATPSLTLPTQRDTARLGVGVTAIR